MVVELAKPVEDEGVDIDMVPIFVLDGVTYSIPDRVRPNLSFKYLWMVRQVGPVAAEAWLCEAMLGKDAYVAYLNCDYITQEQSDAIFSAARSVVFGEIRPKSPSSTPATTSTTPKKSRASSKRSVGQSTAKRPSKATSADSTV